MSGHSKWSTIKRAKGVNDVKRSQSFTKMANALSIASRLGGSGNPDDNPRLRMVMDEARSINMPKENVQRAIDRGPGKLPGQTVEEVVYEGFGPGKVAFIVEAVTDNKNRTISLMRNLFERAGGSLGSSGSASYMFEKKGEIVISSKGGSNEDELLELIDLGVDDAEDFSEEGSRQILVYVDKSNLNDMSTKIAQLGYSVNSSLVVYKPNVFMEVNQQDGEKVMEFVEKLESLDDTQKVYANFDILNG